MKQFILLALLVLARPQGSEDPHETNQIYNTNKVFFRIDIPEFRNRQDIAISADQLAICEHGE